MVSALDSVIPDVDLLKWQKTNKHLFGLLVISGLFSVSILALVYSASAKHRKTTHATTIGQWADYLLQAGASLLAVCTLLVWRFADSSILKASVVASMCIIILASILIAFDRDHKYTSVYRHRIGAPGGYACLTSTFAVTLLVYIMDAKA
jgi:cell division protein FtsW (lipid II flippase)